MSIKGRNLIAELLEERKAVELEAARKNALERRAEGQIDGRKYVLRLKKEKTFRLLLSDCDVWKLYVFDETPHTFADRTLAPYRGETYSMREYELASRAFDMMVRVYDLTVV